MVHMNSLKSTACTKMPSFECFLFAKLDEAQKERRATEQRKRKLRDGPVHQTRASKAPLTARPKHDMLVAIHGACQSCEDEGHGTWC